MEAVKNIDLTILEYSHSAETKARTKLSASYIKQGVSNKEDIYHYRWIRR
jgi:aspartate aminotransferase